MYLICKNLSSHHQMMLCVKFACKWPSGSGEEDINFVNLKVFLLFRYYLPSEKGMAFHFNKLEFPLPKDALWQVWLKFGPVVLEKIKMWKV